MQKMIAVLFVVSTILGMSNRSQALVVELRPLSLINCPYGAVKDFFVYGQSDAGLPESLVISAVAPALHLISMSNSSARIECQGQGRYVENSPRGYTCVPKAEQAADFAQGFVVSDAATPICAIPIASLPAGFVDVPTAVVTKQEGDLVTVEVHGALKKRVVNGQTVTYAQALFADDVECSIQDGSTAQSFICTLEYDLSKPDRRIPDSVFISALPNRDNKKIGTGTYAAISEQVGYSGVENRLCPENSVVSQNIDQSSPDALRESVARYGRCVCNTGFIMDEESDECVADPIISSKREDDRGPSKLGMNRGGMCTLDPSAARAPASWSWLLLLAPLLGSRWRRS